MSNPIGGSPIGNGNNAKLSKPQLSALDGLTEKQRAYVLAYVGEAQGDQTKAARMAGYADGSAAITGCKLMKLARVQLAIRRLTVPSAHARAQRQVEGELAKLVNEIDSDPNLANEATKRDRAIRWLELAYSGKITETRTTKFGEPFEATPSLAPRVRALEVLAKLEGWAPAEKSPGTKDNPLHVVAERDPELAALSDAELEVRKAQLEALRAQVALKPAVPQSNDVQN